MNKQQILRHEKISMFDSISGMVQNNHSGEWIHIDDVVALLNRIKKLEIDLEVKLDEINDW